MLKLSTGQQPNVRNRWLFPGLGFVTQNLKAVINVNYMDTVKGYVMSNI